MKFPAIANKPEFNTHRLYPSSEQQPVSNCWKDYGAMWDSPIRWIRWDLSIRGIRWVFNSVNKVGVLTPS